MDFEPNTRMSFGQLLDMLHDKRDQLVLIRPHKAIEGGMFLIGTLKSKRLTVERPWIRLSLHQALRYLGTRRDSGWDGPLGRLADDGFIELEISSLLIGDKHVIEALLALPIEDASKTLPLTAYLDRPIWELVESLGLLSSFRKLLPDLVRHVHAKQHEHRTVLDDKTIDEATRRETLKLQYETTKNLLLYLSLALKLDVSDGQIRKLQAFYGASP
jgi:hypothetical protein